MNVFRECSNDKHVPELYSGDNNMDPFCRQHSDSENKWHWGSFLEDDDLDSSGDHESDWIILEDDELLTVIHLDSLHLRITSLYFIVIIVVHIHAYLYHISASKTFLINFCMNLLCMQFI